MGEETDDEFSFAVWPKEGAEVDARRVRALTPSDAAEKCAPSDFGGTRDWRIDYRVRNSGTSKLYDVRVGVVPQPSFVAIQATEVAMDAATHVMWGGRVLCEDLRLRGVPRDWPAGQRWISLRDVADGVDLPPDRCATCWDKAPGLVEGLRQIGAR